MKEHSQQLRIRSVQRQHPAIKFQQTAMIAKIDDRRRPAHDRNCAHAVRHPPRGGVGVGRTSGNRENMEALDFEVIGELLQHRRPIDQFAICLKR